MLIYVYQTEYRIAGNLTGIKFGGLSFTIHITNNDQF